jgi:hypothetical protein
MAARQILSQPLSRTSEFDCEPSVAGIKRTLPKGVVPALAARLIEGLRKGGHPGAMMLAAPGRCLQ